MRISLALTVLALALLVVPGAFAERSYSDPAGDSGVAPDITGVAVSHDAAGVVTLAVTTNQPTLAADATMWGYFDVDRNPATGFAVRGVGAEHFFIADADGGVIFHIVGSSITIDFDSSFEAGYANGVFTARFERSELGSTDRFAFVIEADQSDANGDTQAFDLAPDRPPAFEYSFIPLTLTLGPAAGTPKVPVAGKRFVVGAKVTRSDAQPFTSGAVSCTAKVGKVTLKPAGSVASGSARCVLKVPKSMAGKTLRGSMTVSADDSVPVTRPFVFRIR